MSKKNFCIERKMQFCQFEYESVKIDFSKKAFSVSAVFDLSYDAELVPDSFVDVQDLEAATCAFGFLCQVESDVNNKSEKIAFMLSDKNCFCICRIKDGLSGGNFILPWQRLSKNQEKTNHLLRIDFSGDKFSFYIDDEWVSDEFSSFPSNGKIGFAGQNYMVHEKVLCTVKNFRIKTFNPSKKQRNCRKADFEKVLFSDEKPSSIQNFDEAWDYYQQARMLYEKDEFLKAKSFILAAASDLSENLAVLELYGFICSKIDSDELPRIIRLIKSNQKHAPYVQSYRDECESLIQRLEQNQDENQNVNIKFSIYDKAVFLLEKPVIPLI